jgi:hypothetical protein
MGNPWKHKKCGTYLEGYPAGCAEEFVYAHPYALLPRSSLSQRRQTMRVHFPAYLRRQPEMAAPLAVQRAEHTFPLDHFFSAPPSSSASILPPSVARNKSRWWRRPESRSYQRSSWNQRCRMPSMCSNIPGSGRPGRRLRCTPRLRPRASPAPYKVCFTQL